MAAARRSPEHPPYALMIGEAIQALDEEQGSTLESISQHIKAHYDQLPPGHDRLLPYYMNKLIVRGEFSRLSNGRYVIAQDEEEDQVFEDRRKNPPAGNRNKDQDCANIKEPMKAPVLDDEGVPMDCKGDLVMEIRALAQIPAVGLGGPEVAAVESEPAVANKGGNSDMGPVVALPAVGCSAMEKDELESMPMKRQGRPRRKKEAEPIVDGAPFQVVEAQQEPMLMELEKRRGRQSKGRHLLGPDEGVEKPMGYEEEQCDDEKDGSLSVAKKPGRRTTTSKATIVAQDVAKRRGRPPRTTRSNKKHSRN